MSSYNRSAAFLYFISIVVITMIVRIHGAVSVQRRISRPILDTFAASRWAQSTLRPGRYPFTFSTSERLYLLQGRVTVTINTNPAERRSVEAESGDLLAISRGTSCVWTVHQPITYAYHYP